MFAFRVAPVRALLHGAAPCSVSPSCTGLSSLWTLGSYSSTFHPWGGRNQLSMTLLVECLPLPCSPLVVGQVHRSNASITSRVNVQLLEVTSLPDLHHTIVPSRHQVLAIAAQENGLQKKHSKPTFLSKSVVTAKKHSVYSIISISSC